MKTFEQFVESKEFYEHGFPQVEVEGPCWIYDLSCYISVEPDGSFSLVIENQDWINEDISVLEALLYYRWYRYEYQ